MTTYLAFTRLASGSPMPSADDVVTVCRAAGFTNPRTHLYFSNAIFDATAPAATVKTTLEQALTAKVGSPVGVLLRTAAELAAIVKDNPFKREPPERVAILFYDELPEKSRIDAMQAPANEKFVARGRELIVYYPDGANASKLRIPNSPACTGRNLKIVSELVELTRD